MAQNVEQIREKIKLDKRFAINTDESVDVSDEAELLLYGRYFDDKVGLLLMKSSDVNNYQNIQRENHKIGIRFAVGMVY
jgi:hypothetical protein